MELEQLRQLVAIVESGTLQGAADELHLSQSALSRSLKRLESDLGQPLFDRTRNSMSINDHGRIALEHARAILAEVQRLRDDFDALARRERTIRVASVAPAPTWRIGSIVMEEGPTTIIEPDIIAGDEVRSRLLSGACDLAVTTQPVDLPVVRSRAFMHEDLYANVPEGDELYEREALSFADMDGRAFLVYGAIGFWHDVHVRNLPHATFVTQRDRTLFLQQVRSTKLLAFTTNAPENTNAHPLRRAIPITDADAHATFYLSVRADATERVATLFDLVASGGEHQNLPTRGYPLG